MKEEWRKVAGFPGYMISNLGVVCSTSTWEVVPQAVNQAGFSTVALSVRTSKGSMRKPVLAVHRLLVISFGAIIMPKEVVLFIDGDQGNVRHDNLRVASTRVSRARLRALVKAKDYQTAKFLTIVECNRQAAPSEFYDEEEDAWECRDEELEKFPKGSTLSLWPVYDPTQTRGAKVKSLTSILKTANLKNDFTP